MQLKHIILLLLLFIFASPVFAENAVYINEIQIEPNQAVELINTGSAEIDLSNWYLDDNGGTTYFTIRQNTILLPNSCVVFSSNINLNTSSPDTIRLFNNTAPPTSPNAQLIDSYTYDKSPGNTITFTRKPDGIGNWITDFATLGKFNGTNTSCVIIPTPTIPPSPTITPTLTMTPTRTPTPELISIANIYISEVMPYPDSNGKEWVEIYNDNDFPVNLINWYIDDVEDGGSAPKKFSLEIPAKGYEVYELPASMFNNDYDTVRLLDSNKDIVDVIEYEEPLKDKTIGRHSFSSNNVCIQDKTVKRKNSDCIDLSTSAPTPKVTTPTSTPSPTTIPAMISIEKNENRYSQTLNNDFVSTDYSLPNTKIVQMESTAQEVLGVSEHSNDTEKKAIATATIFSSFSYSFLAILSLVLKIKNSFSA